MNARALAADILVQVIRDKKSLSATLETQLPGIAGTNDRAFVQALTYGVLRWYWRLDKVLGCLTRKPIKDEQVRMLALLGLFQLRFTRVKPHAAVSETVAAVGGKSWARPLLNAILRTYQREQAEVEARADESESSRYGHPEWLVRRLASDWPEDYQRVLGSNNEPPPMSLRVNRLKLTRADFLTRLATHEIAARPSATAIEGVTLEKPIPVEAIPGFEAGDVSVQDHAAQLAAGLLNLEPGLRVLDLCAAPGGKTAHMRETCPELAELHAVDISAERLSRVSENLDRIQQHARLIVGDATEPAAWWDGRLFDRILVDAPCSATGVIRRHPDIKVLRQASDIGALGKLQQQILAKAWEMLTPGGQLLYATCSVLRAENEAVISRFLSQQTDAAELCIHADWGIPVLHGRQILTGMDEMDGFYYARLVKRPSCD